MFALLLVAGVVAAGGKEEVVTMTPKEFVAIIKGKMPEAEAKKNWNGKTGEFIVTNRASWQDVKKGPHAGEVLFSFRDQREGRSRKFPTLPFYVKDAKTIAALKNREGTDSTPIKIRGRIVIDYTGFRLWLEDAHLVKD